MAGETEPRLVLEQDGPGSINTRHRVLVQQGEQTHELDSGISGNFDSTPYKPESFYWRLEAELHRVEGQWVVLVAEIEEKHAFSDRKKDWVTTRHEQPRAHLLTDEGWVEIRRGDATSDPRWVELEESLGPETKVARENR